MNCQKHLVYRFELHVGVMVFQKADSKTSTETNKRLLFLNSQFMYPCLLCFPSSSLWLRNQLRFTIFLRERRLRIKQIMQHKLKFQFSVFLFHSSPKNVVFMFLCRANLNMLFAKLFRLTPMCWCNALKNNYWLLIHTDWLPSRTELDVSGVFCAVCWMGINEPEMCGKTYLSTKI